MEIKKVVRRYNCFGDQKVQKELLSRIIPERTTVRSPKQSFHKGCYAFIPFPSKLKAIFLMVS